MLKQSVNQIRPERVREGGIAARADVLDDLKRCARELYPMLLDGMLASSRRDMGSSTLRAMSNLARQPAADRLSGERLRECLDAVKPAAKPKTRAGIVPVSPRRMRAWWDRELLGGGVDAIGEADRPKGVLRFYDVSGLPANAGQWNQTFDVDADFAAPGQTIDFWAADKTYRVELGLAFPDGRFVRLAEMPACSLPRECPGPRREAAFVKSNLPAAVPETLSFRPDVEAWRWFHSAGDWPLRDENAELILHMVYRRFLVEGPRVLRKVPELLMPAREDLERRYQTRRRTGIRPRAAAKTPAPGNRIVTLLDAGRELETPRIVHPAALARKSALEILATNPFPLSRYYYALSRCMNGAVWKPAAEAAAEAAPDVSHLVKSAPDDVRESFAWRSASIFEAAKGLNRDLAGIPAMAAAEPVREKATPEAARPACSETDTALSLGGSPDIGGAEGRRFAKAGVSLSRMALSLEGRVRPGAKFKVAGKFVTADQNGRFRVECVLSGKSIRIPMRVDNGRAGLARGLLRIEWDQADGGGVPAQRNGARARQKRNPSIPRA